jgi:pimeloyl-ACP methyl ester carboxylesterase
MRRRDFLRVGMAATTVGASRRAVPGHAQSKHELRDLIVLLPGIGGSVLQKDARDVWALSGSAIVQGLRTLGASLTTGLRLAGDAPDATDLGDGITATRLLPDTHLLPGLWKIDGYTHIRRTILNTFTATPNRNYFEFPYDWRRDNRAAARRLAQDSLGWLKAWQQSSGATDARLILVAHSMGGLVARHFLEVLGGWRSTRMLVTFGTPFRGAVGALRALVEGLAVPGVIDLSAAVRSWTSVYQLLPRYACYDQGDGRPVRAGETQGIPNVDAQRAAAGLRFHVEIDAARAANQRDTAYRDSGYTLHTVVGTFQPTLQYARRIDGRVRFEDRFPNQAVQGDGTVPEISAIPLEMGISVPSFPLTERHASLQNAALVLDFLTTVLSRGAINPTVFQGDALAKVALDLDDVYPSGGLVTIRARCDDPGARLVARIFRRDSDPTRDNREINAFAMARDADGSQVVDVPGLPEGTYRATVEGGAKVGRASDVFLVA